MTYKYYQVYQYYDGNPHFPEGKRLVYTFDNEMAANELIEFLIRNDFMDPNVGVEEHEASTEL